MHFTINHEGLLDNSQKGTTGSIWKPKNYCYSILDIKSFLLIINNVFISLTVEVRVLNKSSQLKEFKSEMQALN